MNDGFFYCCREIWKDQQNATHYKGNHTNHCAGQIQPILDMLPMMPEPDVQAGLGRLLGICAQIKRRNVGA